MTERKGKTFRKKIIPSITKLAKDTQEIEILKTLPKLTVRRANPQLFSKNREYIFGESKSD